MKAPVLAALGIWLAAFPSPSVAFEANGKRIALTFDDAPRGDGPVFTGEERAGALIAALEEAGAVPSAFFVTTGGFEQEPDGRERIARYAAAGHLIANHSKTHPWLHRTDLDAYLADLDAAEGDLEGFENRRPWFRFPFLDEGRGDLEKRDGMRAALAERKLLSGYVTIDTYDWHLATRFGQAMQAGRRIDTEAVGEVYTAMIVDAAEHYDRMALEHLGRRPAQVLLLHENDPAALFIAGAVAALEEKGWRIISPDEAFSDPIADVAPRTTFSGMGRISAIAHDQGARGREAFDHWSASEAGIDRKLEEAKAFGN
jgi:peptidoglycan/xylan/chitin deacetylase (PgdA/CDA1 family)